MRSIKAYLFWRQDGDEKCLMLSDGKLCWIRSDVCCVNGMYMGKEFLSCREKRTIFGNACAREIHNIDGWAMAYRKEGQEKYCYIRLGWTDQCYFGFFFDLFVCDKYYYLPSIYISATLKRWACRRD